MNLSRGTSRTSRTSREDGTSRRTSRVTERIRWAAADAERHADREDTSNPDPDSFAELDDGPTLSDLPEWIEGRLSRLFLR